MARSSPSIDRPPPRRTAGSHDRTDRHSRLGLVVNVTLVALAFGLLGLVIWQNAREIRKVFGRPLDLRLLALALAIYLIGMVGTFVRWFFLVRVIEPKFTFARHVCWVPSARSSTW